MNTSEALDLSKENIQPLKQGRNAVKLGTALQAQSNAELHQQLMAEREQFELLIRMYEGEDPLQPHYDYVRWIEQSFPKHGPESNLVQVLENTLAAFKDDPRYKQDLRYAELLIKYIDTQANPLDIYQIVYEQGLCTMCAPFYKAWAEEYDKINDIKSADRIFDLGIKVKALPLELLPEAQLRFQLSLGRRMLGYQEEAAEAEGERSRQALHKLQKKNVFGDRDAVGAPGRVRQQVLGTHNTKSNANAPFKIYQADDYGHEGHGDGQGKMFPKQGLVNKENSLKAGPWTQQGGKHRSRGPVPSVHGPAFQVHEDEDAEVNSGHPKTPAVPRALKPRKIDNFTCPLAVFEPPDPTKQPMYCKNKVYAGGWEFQFEELRAALYNRRYERLLIEKRRKEEEEEMRQKAKNEATYVKVAPDVISVGENFVAERKEEEVNGHHPQATLENDQESLFKNHLQSPAQVNIESHTNNSAETEEVHEKSEPHFEEPQVDHMQFEHKNLPLEANTSVFHCQSFTVNTKEAMNVVQEMWQSPTPSPAFTKNMRASRPFPVSPANLDESGVFKVPIAPAPHKSPCAKKGVPFPVFSDEEPSPAPTPTPTPTPTNFQIYSDEAENELPKQTKSENPKTITEVPLPFPIVQPSVDSRKGTDVATMKMLAFQSDSDEECDVLPKPCIRKVGEKEKPYKPVAEVPTVCVTSATPLEGRKSMGPGFVLHPPGCDEDKFEDMTCNTKAFDFALPSSTPLVGHFQSKADHHARNNVNGSYIAEDVKKCVTTTRQDLSIVFEASKERYSSSSGSSGSKTQASVCTVEPAQPELLDKLAQISANKSLDEMDKSLGLLKIAGPIDPFSTELIEQLLSHIGYPRKHHLIGLVRLDADCPALHTNSSVTLGNTKYSVIGELGKGSYARVLKAARGDSGPVALKQQRPAWEWEWYIVQELQSRLPPNMMSGYLHMSTGYIYKNASILESEWAQYGSILSVINKMKIAGKGHDLNLALLFSVQLVRIIEHLHKCRIIHGDVKPDNFVLFSLPTVDVSEPCLKLIDFGRSIDMTLFPADTTFTTVVTTDGFQCNEMKEGRPWTYQTDLYGLAGSIYCVLFNDYMKVKKDKKWQLSNKVPRYMKPALWTEVFSVLLNVESCENQPDLTSLREKLELNFKELDSATVQASINKLTNILLNK